MRLANMWFKPDGATAHIERATMDLARGDKRRFFLVLLFSVLEIRQGHQDRLT